MHVYIYCKLQVDLAYLHKILGSIFTCRINIGK